MRRLDPDPIAVDDTETGGVNRMQERQRRRRSPAQHFDVALTGLEVRILRDRPSSTVNGNSLDSLRCLAVVGQRIETEFREQESRTQLDLARRCRKPGSDELFDTGDLEA